MKNRDKFFFDIVMRVREQSTCRGSQHGAVISISDRIVAEGWNSPVGALKPHDCRRCDLREAGTIQSGEMYEDVICIHAEQNAVAQCALLGIKLQNRNATLWTDSYPCTECTRIICASGIAEVVYFNGNNIRPISKLLFDGAGVITREFNFLQ